MSEFKHRRLGRASVPSPESASSNAPWHQTQPEPVRRFDNIHLGRFQPEPGTPYHYRDAVDTHLPYDGFSVRVAQGSQGATVLSAIAAQGYEVAAAEFDAEGELQWRAKSPGRENLVIAAGSGNWSLGRLETRDYSALGNPGQYWGVLRLTAQASGAVRYYAVGADFEGEPDNWRVRGTVLEVAPNEPPLLSAE